MNVSTNLSFTRNLDLDMGSWLWFAMAIVVIYGSTNGVNLTDGIDGLAAGSATLVFVAFMIIAFWQFRHPGVYEIIPAAALDLAVIVGRDARAHARGSCGGTPRPARVFMGDTGSLAIGGAMAGLALLTHTVLLLPILGGLYVVETLSVIAQVVSFRGVPPAGAAHGADPPPLRGRRLARVHRDRALLAVRRASCVAVGLGIFYADFINIPGVID